METANRGLVADKRLLGKQGRNITVLMLFIAALQWAAMVNIFGYNGTAVQAIFLLTALQIGALWYISYRARNDLFSARAYETTFAELSALYEKFLLLAELTELSVEDGGFLNERDQLRDAVMRAGTQSAASILRLENSDSVHERAAAENARKRLGVLFDTAKYFNLAPHGYSEFFRAARKEIAEQYMKEPKDSGLGFPGTTIWFQPATNESESFLGCGPFLWWQHLIF